MRTRIAANLTASLVALMMFTAPLAALAATPRSVLVGVYPTETGAQKAFVDLKAIQKTKKIEIDAFAVVEKNADGKVSVHDTQQRDSRWGAVAGGILGLLVMGPIGAVAGASGGGLTGWLTGKVVGIPQQDIDNIKSALEPNSSAIVAVVDNKWVGDLEKEMRKDATKAFIRSQLADQEAPAAAH